MTDNKQVSAAVSKVLKNEKVSMVINGQRLDGINPKGEDIPELRKNKVDYSQYETLTDFFKAGLIQFSYFISRSIPDELKKVNPDEQELHSSRSGIKAYDKCIKLLTKELNTGKTGYKEPKDYKKLSDWYVNGLIDFMGITMVDIPDELDNPDDLDHVVKSAIEAFKQVKKLLSDEVKELTHVQ